jgi:hypothetical protein
MREIIFKAKQLDNGKWVEGDYCKLDETTYCISEDYERYPVPTHHYILHETMTDWGLPNRFLQIEINPDTLCQFTGLTDKNGKKIWENDILELPSEDSYFTCEWEEDTARFVMNGDGLTVDFDNYWGYQTEVVGNIFDNADLLEVE